MPARKKSKLNPPKPTAATTTVDISASLPTTTGSGQTASKALAAANVDQRQTSAAGDTKVASDVQETPPVEGDQKVKEDDKNSLAASTTSVDVEMRDADSQPRPSRSWYGSWQRSPMKDSPSNASEKDLSRSSGSVAQTVQPAPSSPSQKDLATTPTRRATTSYLSPGASSRSLPLTATTKLNISSDGSLEETSKQKRSSLDEQNSKQEKPVAQRGEEVPKPTTPSVKPTPKKVPSPSIASTPDVSASKNTPQKPAAQCSPKPSVLPAAKTAPVTAEPPPPWTSWFGKQRADTQVAEDQQTQPRAPPKAESAPKPKDDSKSVTTNSDRPNSTAPVTAQKEARKDQKSPRATTVAQEEASPRPRSWLGLWSGGKEPDKPASGASSTKEGTKPDKDANKATELNVSDAKPDTEKVVEPLEQAKDQKSDTAGGESNSGWAFWSRAPATANKRDVGELAVAGSSSQSQPENAVYSQNGMPKTVAGAIGNKRVRPASLDFADDARSISSKRSLVVDKKAAELVSDASRPKTPTQRPVSRKDDTEHLLLPLFHQTYPEEPESPSLLQQIGRLFYGKPPDSKYPLRLKEPARIKHALAIGVHGYFPAALVQTVLGRPTGTSIKFAEAAAKAIHKYAQQHQHTPVTVEKIALEGEGKIEERLDILWKLLLNWIDKIRHADFIIIACHSQGVPVAISLAAKLIGFGCIHGARLGICAMAGVNLGPFVDYKSRFIGGSAGELFEFARSDSTVSKAYETALSTVVRSGAKVVYVGSMDDQLVSLQSSTFGTAEHPSIYRAVWIDGRIHVPDFLTSLVGFALKLRNLGVPDHGLVRELSNPLAGSLVGGEGHSRIYEDEAVYDLAVEFTAGTTSLHTHDLKMDKAPSVTSQNPYILPFAMRGLLEEEFVRTELSNEALELLKKFDDWKPTTKVLKDVKYRLEGVRSKL